MVAEVPVEIFGSQLLPNKPQGGVSSTENERFPRVDSDLARSYGVLVVFAQRPAVYLMPAECDCVVVGDAVLDENLREDGTQFGEVKVLMSDGVRDVPVIGADCVQRTGVLSEPVNAGDTAVFTTVSLNGYPLTEVYNTGHTKMSKNRFYHLFLPTSVQTHSF